MTSTSEGKIGKYEIVRVLRRGGMGEVILAQDKALGRMVAIKRPLKSALQEGLARFQIEARAATLNHRNIPAIYELGVEDGLPFIAMEYVEGEPLDKIIASGRHLELITKLGIIEQVCSALEHAHQKGIIHRDIKPDNVIVQPDGVVKLIDFGIAKLKSTDPSANLTQASLLIGTLHYIAPERFRGETVDGRADIFSTGVMLYLLLTGELPFPGAEATASYKIVNEAPTPLATHMRNYPPALDAILDRALAKSPSQRYATAEDFGEALHEVIDGLKRNRVVELFDDAERLTTECRFEPALELLNEAMTLDPANTQVRKLRKFVREQHDKVKRAESLRDLLVRADQAAAADQYAEAISLLKEASDLDPDYPDLKDKLGAVEARKRAYERASGSVASADAIRDKDINGAIRIVEKAQLEDPENPKLRAARESLLRQAQTEAQQSTLRAIFDSARSALAARDFRQVESLLGQASSIDPAHPEISRIASEASRLRDQEERRHALDQLQSKVRELAQRNEYDQALGLVDRALEQLPNDSGLNQLRAEIAESSRQLAHRRAVEDALSRANLMAQNSPSEALKTVQSVLEQFPGDQRLIGYQQTLQQQLGLVNQTAGRAETIQLPQTSAQQTERLLQHVASLRQQNRLDEAIQLLRQQLSATPNDAQVAQQLNVLVTSQNQARSAANSAVSGQQATLVGGYSAGPNLPPPPPWLPQPTIQPIQPQNRVPDSGSAAKPSSSHTLLWVLGALLLVAIAAGGALWWKLHPTPPAQAHLRIAKVPPGAIVSIDHGPAQQVDRTGQFASSIPAGDHLLEVSMPGFEPFSEKLSVGVGETVNYPAVTLVPAPVVGTSGKLIPQGNLPDYRLTVDHEYRGILHQGDPVAIKQGLHTIRYENADSSDFQEHQLTIIANQDLTDSFTLKAPKPTQANPGKGSISHDSQARLDTHTPALPDSAEATAKKITDAHDRFEAAYDSKDIDRLKAEWLDIGQKRTEQMTDIFKRADTVLIHEKCTGQPAVTGSTAAWRCTEIVQLNKNFFGPSPKTLEFAKVGSKWYLKDK